MIMAYPRLLIIGKYGQIGGYLRNYAKDCGFEAIALGRDEINVLQPNIVRERLDEIRPAILINTAAYHVVRECEENPREAYEMNTFAVGHLAQMCRDRKALFLTFSSDYVFDGKKRLPYEENDVPNPLQVYGKSKYAGERSAQAIYPDGTIIVRTSGVYGGEGSRSKKGNIVLNLLEQAKANSQVEVAVTMMGSPSYAGDVARAALSLVSRDAAPGIYHLVNDGAISWAEFGTEVLRQAGMRAEVMPVWRTGTEDGIARPLYSALANTRAKIFGVELPSWQSGIRAYLAERGI
jgi:dTDP-4-dehydrorhamnose reductase